MLLEHSDPYAAHLADTEESPFMLSQYPNYPASGLFFLWPYAIWDWSVAKVLWAISNLIFTVMVLFCLFRFLPAPASNTTKLLLSSLFIMGTPWRVGIGNGQHALFTLAFFLFAVTLFRGSRKTTGIALTVSWFKYTLAFPLTLFFARSKRGFGAILFAAITHAALTLFLSFWIRSSPLELLLGPIKVAQTSTATGCLDVFAIATKLGLDSHLLPAIASLLILGLTYAAIWSDADDLSCLSTLALTSIAVVFHLLYDLVVIIIPLCYVLREKGKNIRAKNYLIVMLLVWFVDKIVVSVVGMQGLPQLAGMVNVFFWIKVFVFYGALVTDWIIALSRRKVSSGAHPDFASS